MMFKQRFFDDQRLYVRENLERSYGTPELVATYRDNRLCPAYCWAWLVKGPDGRTNLIYQGFKEGTKHNITAAAISDDGINFVPRNTAAEAGITDPVVPNQLMPSELYGEIAGIIEDHTAPEEERYKMLFTDNSLIDDEMYVRDYVFVSPDLIHWKELRASNWNPAGTEPLAGVFYNKVAGKFTIMARPHWGQRRVGITETVDWHYFSPMEMCLQVDSMDPALAEIYGMPVFADDDIFIGFPHIFADHPQIMAMKFKQGTMHPELSYSLNGHHWQRSLRTPFLAGDHPQLVERDGVASKMLFVNSAMKQADGSILLSATTNLREHGCVPEEVRTSDTSISIFRVRPDGFIALHTGDEQTVGRLASREIIWNGGELEVNLNASRATCAIYGDTGNDIQPLPGFSHEECVPFSGDDCHWQPQWKSGALMNSLAGKTVVVEIKLENGTIYSFSGAGIRAMEIEAARYRKFGKIPNRPGF